MHGSTMRISTSGSNLGIAARRTWLIALCACGALLSTTSYAGEVRHRGNDHHHSAVAHWSHGRHHDRRDWNRRDRHERIRHSRVRRVERPPVRHYHPASGWHYVNGRYWAPPSYRGRLCRDLRHFHGVHYHVAVRDYYDYYYPRYRYLGPRPHGANASVIISIPLF